MADGHRCRDRPLTALGTVTISIAAGAGIGRRQAAAPTASVNAEAIAWAVTFPDG
jgi:hypothetical protein